jgi:hypothetical protein
MSDTIAAIAACTTLMVAVAALAVGILKVIDRAHDAYFAYYDTPERRSAERIAEEARLLRPDWWYYEQHLQRPIPPAVRALYADHPLLFSIGLQYDDIHNITEFCPLDSGALVEVREFMGFDVLPLATSEGDIVYLRPGTTESDVVYVTYHDGGDTGELAPDPATFLERLRAAVTKQRASAAALQVLQ